MHHCQRCEDVPLPTISCPAIRSHRSLEGRTCETGAWPSDSKRPTCERRTDCREFAPRMGSLIDTLQPYCWVRYTHNLWALLHASKAKNGWLLISLKLNIEFANFFGR